MNGNNVPAEGNNQTMALYSAGVPFFRRVASSESGFSIKRANLRVSCVGITRRSERRSKAIGSAFRIERSKNVQEGILSCSWCLCGETFYQTANNSGLEGAASRANGGTCKFRR